MIDVIIFCQKVLMKLLVSIIFKFVKHSSKNGIVQSGQSEKLKSNSLLGRFYDCNRSESQPTSLASKIDCFFCNYVL